MAAAVASMAVSGACTTAAAVSSGVFAHCAPCNVVLQVRGVRVPS
jgi:hypothetical protein